MAITIPSLPNATSTEYTLNSSATDQKPYLGGPVQRISRMGDKWSVKVQCPPLKARQAAAVLATLTAGLSEKVVLEVRQPGLDLSAYNDTGTVTGAAAGRTMVHAGGGTTKFVGQLFSVISNGVRYLHQITLVSGQTINFVPMLKVPLAGGETIEFRTPKIEGFITGNSQSWTQGRLANVGVTFQVDEAQ
jgi:hypothetical protein